MVTFADSPGLIGPVVHEPSRAAIVCPDFPVLTNVTTVPDRDPGARGTERVLVVTLHATVGRANRLHHGGRQLEPCPSSTMRPSHGCTVKGAGGADRGGTGPAQLEGPHDLVHRQRDVLLSTASNVATGPPPFTRSPALGPTNPN